MLVSDIDAGKRAMIVCVTDIELWCQSYELKLNADKSDVIWLGSRPQLAKLSEAEKNLINLPSSTLWASETARNLGVV